MRSVSTATLVRALAVVVVVLGLVVGAAGVVSMLTVNRLLSAFGGSETASSVERSLASAEEAIEESRAALTDVEKLAGSVSASTADAAEVIHGAATLTSERIPDTLRDVEATMPALIEAGAAIDSTLRALSLFGVGYDPGTPFDEALIELDRGLDGLPEQIEAQGTLLAALGDQLGTVGAETDAVATRISVINDSLLETGQATAEMAAAAGSLQGVATALGPAAVTLEMLFVALALLAMAAGVVLWSLARRMDPPAG